MAAPTPAAPAEAEGSPPARALAQRQGSCRRLPSSSQQHSPPNPDSQRRKLSKHHRRGTGGCAGALGLLPPGSLQDPPVQRGWVGRRQSASVSAAKGASDVPGQHFSATSFCPGVTRGAFPGQSWLPPRGGQAEGTARAPQSSAGARVPRDAKTASGSRPSPRCPGGPPPGKHQRAY